MCAKGYVGVSRCVRKMICNVGWVFGGLTRNNLFEYIFARSMFKSVSLPKVKYYLSQVRERFSMSGIGGNGCKGGDLCAGADVCM